MDLLATIKAGAASVIIVDNLFAGPDLTRISAESRNDFLEALEESAEVREALRGALGIDLEDPRGLLEAALVNARILWDQYAVDRSANHYLFPLLGLIAAENAEVFRLKELIGHLEDFFGHAPETFVSLDDARDALGRCAIAFVDLFINDAMNLAEILDLHKGHRESYKHGFGHDQQVWPKLVVLISTRLPDEDHLRSFREGAGLRSAFFKPLPKNQISKEGIDRLLMPWSAKYANAALLHRYLDQISDAVEESASSVRRDLDQIEVHDLAVLDASRLLVEGTTLHSYVGWLTSELLAARTRSAAADRTATAPLRAFDGALDTVLLKESVLFDLFADVASSPAESDGRPQFGEILTAAENIRLAEIPVLVAMSPACDLARCAPDYEVLLLRGKMKPLGRNATELLQAGAVFGKGKHFLKYELDGAPHQGAIQWDWKTGLITRPAQVLGDAAAFIRLGRMTELFAYELKDLALSHVSRVGLPITPYVQRAGSVVVRANFALGKGVDPLDLILQAPDAPMICALVTRGRLNEDSSESGVIMLTDAFRAWFAQTVVPRLAASANQSTKLEAVLQNIAAWSEWALHFDSNGKTGAPFADFSVKVRAELPSEQAKGLEILVIAD